MSDSKSYALIEIDYLGREHQVGELWDNLQEAKADCDRLNHLEQYADSQQSRFLVREVAG